MQLETDVILREKIYRSNPRLPHELDKFVHEKVLPQGEKFSSAFNTAKLFTNDNKWIAMYRRGDLEKMRSALRIFVIETLRGVSVSPYVRLFQNGTSAGGIVGAASEAEPTSVHVRILNRSFGKYERIIMKTSTGRRLAPEDYLIGRVLNIALESRGLGADNALSDENIVTYLKSKGISAIGLSPLVKQSDDLYKRGVVQALPFGANEFDTVVSVNFFNKEYFDIDGMHKDGFATYSEFYARAAQEIRRVLKPNGRFFTHIGLYPNPNFLREFRKAGFKIKPLGSSGAYIMVNKKNLGMVALLSLRLKQALDDVLKKLSDKNSDDVKKTFGYVAGIYSTFEKLLKETRQSEEPRYIFMPLPGALSDMKKFAKDILRANGFTNINIIFYDGTLKDLKKEIEDTTANMGTVNPKNGLAYINKKELVGLNRDERERISVTFVKENVPEGGGQFSVGGHVVLALGVLDLINNDRAPGSDYWKLVLGLVRRISKNENKYEEITTEGQFMQKIQMEELEIDLPPIEKETIDQNMRTLSIVEKAVGTSM